jgi:hypothetical protein
MRYLFFLVLLGNVLFYVWEWRADALRPVPLPEKHANDYDHQILLLSEVKTEPEISEDQQQVQVDRQSEDLSTQGSNSNLICFEIGPFDDKNQFLNWNEQNLVKAEHIFFNIKSLKVFSGYMVYYPAAETISQAEENVAILEAKGVSDLWLFKFGEMKGAISLGSHDTEERAKQALEGLEKLGVDAMIKVHSKIEKYTFARIVWNIGEQEASMLIANYKEKFIDQKVEKLMDCSTKILTAQ